MRTARVMRTARWIGFLAGALTIATGLAASAAEPGDIAPGVPAVLSPTGSDSVALGCDVAEQRHTLTTSTHLDPSCTWTAGFDIHTSDVVLDCRGAAIAKSGGGRGIEISSSVDTALSGVVVRNCRVDGFLNSLRITRDGFRTLDPGVEYENGLTGVVIEHSEFRNSIGVGIFVDGYVSDATIRNNVVEAAGSTGVYLETGSRRSHVEGNRIHDNGYRENGPGGQLREFAGLRFRFWGPGREGLAIDGSYENVVVGNSFAGNSHGGLFLYTNCGEFPDSGVWFDRRWPSDNNLIAENTFTGGLNGVWVGQRMAENTLPMECTKPAYVVDTIQRVTLDFAADNTVADNHFDGVTYPIRVEDDGTTVTGNTIESDDPSHHGILIGTEFRTTVLDQPVTDTTIADNAIDVAGNHDPIRWVHGYRGLTVERNTAHGEAVGICEGIQPPRLLLIWAIAIALEPPGAPVTPPPADLAHPVLGALEPCAEPDRPTIVPSGVGITEGEQDAFVIPVALSHAYDRTVSVEWSTLDLFWGAFAAPGQDFEKTNGTLVFSPGQTEATISVTALDDDLAEPDEALLVLFYDPVDATVGGFFGFGIGVMFDDD
ncbi:MAG: right-handed parallel beta-helix repeat-containing protein [Actinomycetota bacterium]